MFRILAVASVLCLGCGVDSTTERKPAPQNVTTDVAESINHNGDVLPSEAQRAASEITRSINTNHGTIKIPEFESEPKYCLLEFGRLNKQQVWIVTDGTSFFVDRNSNGDLTEPNERITDCGLVGYCDPVEIMLDDAGSETVEIEMGLYQREGDPVHHCMKIRIDGQLHQYAGWHEMFSSSPEAAKIYDFGGKYSPVPLRSKHLYQDGDQELHLAFATAKSEKYAKTMLAFKAVPDEITPVAEIDWPASDAAEPIRTKVFLESRC